MKTSSVSRRVQSFAVLAAFIFAGLLAARASHAAYGVSVPSQLRLNIRETAGIARSGEVVRTGVPMPRSLNIKSTATLAVVDAAGNALPADFRITARWNAPLSNAAAPIQWLLVSFPATVGARSNTSYRIVTDGSVANPAPARPLRLTQNGDLITVDTGAAIFRFGSNPGALFDEVILDNGTRLIGGSAMTLRSNGTPAGHSTKRKMWIEHAGPLFASVVITGAYDLAPVGNGGMGTIRRYTFTAGSSTALVRQSVAWEGNLGCNGCVKTTSGAPNGVKLEQIRDTLNVELGGGATVTAVGDFEAPAMVKAVGAGQSAAVRQLLRSGRTAPLRFTVDAAGTTASGVQADGGMLAASGPAGAVAIGLDKMHRFEPQALRLLADGNLAIDIADDQTWLAHHQGLFSNLAVAALAPNPSRADLDRKIWAPLNRPLRAWAEPAWFAASGAVEEFPVGPLPAEVASYDTLIPSVLARTVQKVDEIGLAGLTTFGVYPRYWGKSDGPGEVDCGTADPTPADDWDDKFWCATWTDYHNTAMTIPVWAMRSGEVEWLDELAVPAAQRTLHTQIMQCSPTEKWFYCGQAPAGYGAYRADFNSSHAYFDNLYQYYWLTGDSVVLHLVQRGGDTMRRNMCDTRGSYPVLDPAGPGGPSCGPDHVSTRAEFTGRVATQWINAFRFLGLASTDGSFLEDYRDSLARAATQHYVEARRTGDATVYGFLGERTVVPGTYIGGPVWMFGFYDTNTLWRLQRDTDDAPIGNPALPPSRIIAAVARTLKDIEPSVMGDGTVGGDWPKNLEYTWQGSRIGATLSLVVPNDRPIFTPEKTSVTALFLRTGEQTGEAALTTKGKDMVQVTLTAASNEGAPLGKLQGQYLSRLHAAVARLTNNGSTPPPTAPAAPSALTAQTVSQTEIQLTWGDNSNNEESFRVEQATGTGAFAQVQTLAAGTTSVRITGLAASTAYSFRVRAANVAGTSAYSNTGTATTSAAGTGTGGTVPATPANLVAQTVSTTEIQLTWQDISSNEDNYRVEQLINGVFTQISQRAQNATSYKVIGLAQGTAYTFRVRGKNAAGYSAYSNEASATTQGGTPPPVSLAAPSALTAVAVSGTEVLLTWLDNSANEDNFLLERSIGGGTFTQFNMRGANTTSFRVTGLATGTTYSFRVRAKNVTATSAYSNAASATPGKTANPPSAPAGLRAKAVSRNAIDLTWQDRSANETEFRIERLVDGAYREVRKVEANQTTARISGLSAGTSYTFRVRAVSPANSSRYSNRASATTRGSR